MKRPAARYGFNPFPEPQEGRQPHDQQTSCVYEIFVMAQHPLRQREEQGWFRANGTDQMEAQYQGTLERQ